MNDEAVCRTAPAIPGLLIMESWRRLLEDVKDIEDQHENILLLGDMNRALGDG